MVVLCLLCEHVVISVLLFVVAFAFETCLFYVVGLVAVSAHFPVCWAFVFFVCCVAVFAGGVGVLLLWCVVSGGCFCCVFGCVC